MMQESRRLRRAVLGAVTALIAIGALAAPAKAHGANHAILISGNMYLVDYDWDSANETNFLTYTGSMGVGPTTIFNSWSKTGCADEVRGVIRVEATHSSSTSVEVRLRAYLYEGTSCSTTDFDGYKEYVFTVPLGSTVSKSFTVWNTAEDDPDRMQISIAVKNA
jgi:hypothetical protein